MLHLGLCLHSVVPVVARVDVVIDRAAARPKALGRRVDFAEHAPSPRHASRCESGSLATGGTAPALIRSKRRARSMPSAAIMRPASTTARESLSFGGANSSRSS